MTHQMKHPNNLKALRKAAGLTQEAIAQVWGVHRGDVSRIERGEHSISTHKRDLLTKHFGWTVTQLLESSDSTHVPVLGSVALGGVVALATDRSIVLGQSFRDSATDQWKGELVSLPPGEYSQDLACLKVEGHGMHPVFKDGDLLFFHHQPHAPQSVINSDCVVALTDNTVMVRTLKAGRSFGHYDLDSYNQPSIENVEIKWAAPIAWVKKAF